LGSHGFTQEEEEEEEEEEGLKAYCVWTLLGGEIIESSGSTPPINFIGLWPNCYDWTTGCLVCGLKDLT
jgi:hypothetical protein